MIFAIFSPELVLHHSKLKWIPSPTSPPLKSPPIAMVEVPEAMLTALSPTPPPLTPPPIWMAEAPEATLTALLPKWRTSSYHYPIIIVRFPPVVISSIASLNSFLPSQIIIFTTTYPFLLFTSSDTLRVGLTITYAGLLAAFDFTLCCFISERFTFRQVVFGFGRRCGGWVVQI